MTKHLILIVEDDPININALVAVLRDEYTLLIAKTQAKALEILSTNTVDVMLLDLNLPDGSGFDICKVVRGDREQYGSPAIIMMTGSHSADDELTSLELGASDFVTKPLNNQILKARMNIQIELLRKTRLLNKLARIDGLTEVANRRSFDETLVREWHRCKRAGQPLSLLLVDVDEFKKFNDLYGHAMGDRCLRSVAKVLVDVFKRASDLVARFGGEEFAVIMPNTTQRDAVALGNVALQKMVEQGIVHEQSSVHNVVTFSGGLITTFPVDVDLTAEEIIQQADRQLYAAKHEGRARIMPALTQAAALAV
ncbi:GGDEF domain-containing response regulator [Alteromonas oceanisediminis]|uniref:GGDEF domain-containing response regulator n=1 Tax=Alteromonas oceanisediminis TaxID=2836180 RepID=UPI001BDAA6E5|nr:diguanylate cyclase [Alteromonas oceanisediminis]MBT0587292.1 diguanylate cyclase [Alteromonas oceanisediminis]